MSVSYRILITRACPLFVQLWEINLQKQYHDASILVRRHSITRKILLLIMKENWKIVGKEKSGNNWKEKKVIQRRFCSQRFLTEYNSACCFPFTRYNLNKF